MDLLLYRLAIFTTMFGLSFVLARDIRTARVVGMAIVAMTL